MYYYSWNYNLGNYYLEDSRNRTSIFENQKETELILDMKKMN